MPGMLHKTKPIVARKLEGVNHFHHYLCHQLKGGRMEIIMKKILVSSSHFDTLCQEAWKYLEDNGYEIIFDPKKEFPDCTTEELRTRDDCDKIVGALIGMDDYHDEEKFKLMPNLKAVAKFGVGVDNIDCDLCTKYGVKVINAPGQNSNAVAELTIGMIIDVLRQVIPLHEAMTERKWPRTIGTEIKGKVVGLIGFGAIAKLVAKMLTGFDCRVIAYDLYPDMKAAEDLGVTMTTLEEVIKKSDIVSIHIPATAETYHMFNAETIASMKDGAYIINCARGALIELDALAEALLSGKISGAGLDAFEVEPLPAEASILKCKNIVLTPHTGSETTESYQRVSITAVKDIVRVLNGKEPIHWINKP